MFYFFFESRRKNNTDPVVIWLTGGPGCGSELALFYENGPFHITNNLSLVWNDYGWDKISNIIYIDQPTGTGFSYSSSTDDIRHDEEGVSNDLYDFLQAFFTKHPEYAKNDFYITGSSYAGHYIPAIAGRINQGNKNKEGNFINLKGSAIDTISGSSCETAFDIFNTVFNDILSSAGDVNYYDIRKKCDGSLCYGFSNLETFLNGQTVREALGVGNIEYVSCSSTVYDAMISDIMRNLEVGIPALLEDGIKLLVHAGEYDLICNWLGNSRWIEAMEWSGQKDFLAAPIIPFTVNGVEAGQQKGHGPLTFIKVFNAGHFVAMDQPQSSLEMINRWIEGNL